MAKIVTFGSRFFFQEAQSKFPHASYKELMRSSLPKDDRLPLFALVVAVGSLGVEIWALIRALGLLLSP